MFQNAISQEGRPDAASRRSKNGGIGAGKALSIQTPHLPRAIGNQAALRMIARSSNHQAIPIQQKTVGDEDNGSMGLIDEQSPPTTGGGTSPAPPPAPAGKAGIQYFTVTWQQNPKAGPYNARFHLHYLARFLKGSGYDPACAEFKQNVMGIYECTAGTHQGDKADTSPMHNDHYSRDDDLKHRPRTEIDFESQDNPGVKMGHTEPDDVIDFKFTAEQMIVDICQTPNQTIAHIGPHTGIITGADPRTYSNVPEVFETFD